MGFYSSVNNSDNGDNFLEYNFLAIDTKQFAARNKKERQSKFRAYVADWFDKIAPVFGVDYADIQFSPMEDVKFLGHDGYMKSGDTKLKISGESVRITLKVSLIGNRFVWSTFQQSLDIIQQPSQEIEAILMAIEASFRYSGE